MNILHAHKVWANSEQPPSVLPTEQRGRTVAHRETQEEVRGTGGEKEKQAKQIWVGIDQVPSLPLRKDAVFTPQAAAVVVAVRSSAGCQYTPSACPLSE